MNLGEIKKLITLMNENSLTRLEVEEEGKRYLLEKGGGAQVAAFPSFPAAMPAPMPGPAAPAPDPVAKAEPRRQPEDAVTFNSPMVGTFYRAASPDQPPFVKAGDRVEADTVLCVIEAMKVFNEIRAETTGTLIEVLAENQEAVEYNQPLFLIKPD